jgi:hypothetical protein
VLIIVGQQPLVGSGSGLGSFLAGRQFLEIPVVGHILLVNRRPARLVVIDEEVEFGVSTVLGTGCSNSFLGTGG